MFSIVWKYLIFTAQSRSKAVVKVVNRDIRESGACGILYIVNYGLDGIASMLPMACSGNHFRGTTVPGVA